MTFAEIPVPPSANAIWRAVHSRGKQLMLKSRAYRAWLESAVLVLRIGLNRTSGPVEVTIRVGGTGFNRARDLDNCIKPVIDALRHAQRIDGDSVKTVRRVVAEYLTDGLARCEVAVSRIEPMGGN